MGTPSFGRKHKAVLDSFLLEMPGVVEGRMFSYPAYFVKGKLFACVYGEGVGVKVPEEVAKELLSRRHVVPFQPLGRPKMSGWVQLTRARSADYEKDLGIFRVSIDFVGQLPKAREEKK